MTNLPMRARESPAESTPDPGPGPDDRPLRWFFGVPFRRQTYANLLYLLLAFPLGTVYFVALTAGVSLGFGLIITLVGLPLLAVTLAGATILAAVDARLTAHLVGVEAPLPEPLRAANPRSLSRAEDGLLDSIEAMVTAPTTWTSLLLLVAKFAYGLVAFTAVVTVGTLVAALLAAPFVYGDPNVSYVFGVHTIDTFPEAVVAAAVGVCLVFPVLHLLNGLAAAGGYLTAALLEVPPSESDSDSDPDAE